MVAPTIHVAPEVQASESFRPLVERANTWLREELPASDEPVRAEWTWVDNRPGEEMVALTLKDALSSPTGLFRKRVLEDRGETVHHFNRLIRSLLRVQSHASLKRLQGMFTPGGE